MAMNTPETLVWRWCRLLIIPTAEHAIHINIEVTMPAEYCLPDALGNTRTPPATDCPDAPLSAVNPGIDSVVDATASPGTIDGGLKLTAPFAAGINVAVKVIGAVYVPWGVTVIVMVGV
jgi:hypothetical protein